MLVSQLDHAKAFGTLDGSTIRELAGSDALRLVCCCAPAYTDDDTILTGG
jgi:hypothetical protein